MRTEAIRLGFPIDEYETDEEDDEENLAMWGLNEDTSTIETKDKSPIPVTIKEL